jgi:hypothetical protein
MFKKAMTFDRDACTWRVAGEADAVRRSTERAAVIGGAIALVLIIETGRVAAASLAGWVASRIIGPAELWDSMISPVVSEDRASN